MKRYAILQSISQREDGTLSEESAELARIAHDIIRAGASRSKDERKSTDSSINVVSLNEREQRAAEKWALSTNQSDSVISKEDCQRHKMKLIVIWQH